MALIHTGTGPSSVAIRIVHFYKLDIIVATSLFQDAWKPVGLRNDLKNSQKPGDGTKAID
jgi:hypothetical protein